jgi:hypothetical protein
MRGHAHEAAVPEGLEVHRPARRRRYPRSLGAAERPWPGALEARVLGDDVATQRLLQDCLLPYAGRTSRTRTHARTRTRTRTHTSAQRACSRRAGAAEKKRASGAESVAGRTEVGAICQMQIVSTGTLVVRGLVDVPAHRGWASSKPFAAFHFYLGAVRPRAATSINLS